MTDHTLASLGWTSHFRAQLGPDDTETLAARISGVARDRLTVLSPFGERALAVPGHHGAGDFAVGDWVLTDPASAAVVRRLDRKTELNRRSAGTGAEGQLIAANADTLAIVTSCNADFNIARIERYLALAASAGCLPVIVLTRADEADDAAAFRRKAEGISPLAVAVTLDARDPEQLAVLAPWCGPGQTLALVGSSGVGKTTLANGLTGSNDATAAIREDDAKGRHTTTARTLRPMTAGGWLIDTPGMRSLGLTQAADGIAAVFADIEALTPDCRFADCRHESEPGCAVQAAVQTGDLDAGRLRRWQKLAREEALNSETLAEARQRQKGFGKIIRGVKSQMKGRKGY